MINEIINENVKIVKMWMNFDCTLWTILKRKMHLWDIARFILCSFLMELPFHSSRCISKTTFFIIFLC
jgi:hypothetical protein